MRKYYAGFCIILLMSMTVAVSLADTTARSKNGHLEALLPDGWEQTTLPGSKGKIDAKNTTAGGYAAVLTEVKSDLADQELKQYASTCMKISARASKLKDRKEGDPQELTINDKPAIRYEVTGQFKDAKLKYWFTFFETDKQFIQVLTWSLPSQFDDNSKDFEYICAHVTER